MIHLLLFALLGTAISAVASLVPALHIYNVAGVVLLFDQALLSVLTPEELAFVFLGMVTGYAILNTVPGVLLSVPDESTLFLMLPVQRYLHQGRGYEAIVLSGIGALGGLGILLGLAPFATILLPAIRAALQPHFPWMLWAIIAYLLLSEWPKGTGRPPAGWRRWWEGWKSLFAGMATFALSGLLGILLVVRPMVGVHIGYQNLLPAFVGLFAVPWVVQNLLAQTVLPEQRFVREIEAPVRVLATGIFSGMLGGLFAAFFPVVTGGIGGLLAGQATAQQDERAFIVSQGASKVVYYAGGLLLFFVPGLHLTRGGMAWMLSTHYSAYAPQTFYWAAAAVLVSGSVAFLLSLGLARLMLKLLNRVPYRTLSWITLCLLLGLVGGLTGYIGLAICAVASGIGMIPVLWGARRSHAMGILLLPIALSMIGADEVLVKWLGLL